MQLIHGSHTLSLGTTAGSHHHDNMPKGMAAMRTQLGVRSGFKCQLLFFLRSEQATLQALTFQLYHWSINPRLQNYCKQCTQSGVYRQIQRHESLLDVIRHFQKMKTSQQQLNFSFEKIFIDSYDIHRERQRHRQREKQAPCREPYVGLHPRTPGSCPELKADTEPLSHPEVPQMPFNRIFYIAQ